VRNVFVVGPDKKIKLVLVYPMTTCRFDEVLRVIGSLQLTAEQKVATPAQWSSGDDVIIALSVSDDEAGETYPAGLDARARTSASSPPSRRRAPALTHGWAAGARGHDELRAHVDGCSTLRMMRRDARAGSNRVYGFAGRHLATRSPGADR
jgi:hypothetical protein